MKSIVLKNTNLNKFNKQLKKNNILDLWNNEQFNQVRRRLINKNRSEKPCEKCNVNGLHVGKESFEEWSKLYK